MLMAYPELQQVEVEKRMGRRIKGGYNSKLDEPWLRFRCNLMMPPSMVDNQTVGQSLKKPSRHARGRADIRRRRLAYLERRSEEHTSELQSLMRISYAVLCCQKKTKQQIR